MLKRMNAKRAGPCAGAVETCGGINRGDSIVWDTRSRQAWHSAHGVTGVDSRADTEYMAGVADYNAWKANMMIGGEEFAAAEEIAREMRYGDGY